MKYDPTSHEEVDEAPGGVWYKPCAVGMFAVKAELSE